MANSTNVTSDKETILVALNGLTISCSALVLLILAFTSRRVRLLPQCLAGYPGIVTPVNLLTQSSYHFVYVIIFGAMSADLLSKAVAAVFPLLLSSEFWYFTSNNHIASTFIHTVVFPVIIVGLLSVKYFPLFACVNSPVRILGHIMGMLYSILIISSTIYTDFVTHFSNQDNISVVLISSILGLMPVYICNALVVLWYGWSVAFDFFLVIRNGYRDGIYKIEERFSSNCYYRNYVKKLFQSSACKNEGALSKYTHSVMNCFFPCATTTTRLPLHFVGAIVIVFLVLYQLTLTFSVALIFLMESVINWVIQWESIPSNVTHVLVEVAAGFKYVFPISCVLSCLICYTLLLHMVTCVRGNIRNAMRGNVQFIKTSPSLRVSSSWTYAGYQVSFVLTAYVVYWLFLFLLGSCGLTLYLGFKYNPSLVARVIAYALIPIGWTAFLFLGQVVFCKLLFVRTGGGKFTIITNQRLFHWFSYTLFVYNALLGLAAALLRVLITTVFTSALMVRLDRVVLMKGFESWDIGHKTYMGFIYLEYSYNNPVVNVFIKLLCDSTKKKKPLAHHPKRVRGQSELNEQLVQNVDESPFGSETFNLKSLQSYGATPTIAFSDMRNCMRSRRARNRWLVAYTLLCNPSLQALTASSLTARETAEL